MIQKKNLFDHHQSSFHDTFSKNYSTRLSSAGLIYKHFGEEIIKNLTKSEQYLPVIHDRIYKLFIEHIDAIDNGKSVSETGKVTYQISTDLSSRVGHLNPSWNGDQSDSFRNEGFRKAMELTGTEFLQSVNSFVDDWLPARKFVKEAIYDRFKYDKSGHIMHLDNYCPWIHHLFDIEKEEKIEGSIYYVLFADKDSYRIRAVPDQPGSFGNRLALPQEWRGKRDSELSEVSGIKDCVFVHNSGFIGGNKSFEGALQMARESLKQLLKK